MKTRILSYALICISIINCGGANINEETFPEENVNQTPEVLDEDYSSESSSFSFSRSKKYKKDIISKLYEEALDKNAKLKELNNKINQIDELKSDSLSSGNRYLSINENYWSTTNNYIGLISDSTLRKSTYKMFNNLKSEYDLSLSKYDKKISEINDLTISLEDQLILMKLLVTAPMIKNYQLNEKPNIQKLETIVKNYGELIKESEDYLKELDN